MSTVLSFSEFLKEQEGIDEKSMFNYDKLVEEIFDAVRPAAKKFSGVDELDIELVIAKKGILMAPFKTQDLKRQLKKDDGKVKASVLVFDEKPFMVFPSTVDPLAEYYYAYNTKIKGWAKIDKPGDAKKLVADWFNTSDLLDLP